MGLLSFQFIIYIYQIHVNIYSNHVFYVGGYSRKVSTKLFHFFNLMDAINDFYAKFEQYGNNLDQLPMMQTIRFSKLDKESLDIVKDFETGLNALL